MITYTAYYRRTARAIVTSFPCLAAALAQATRDSSDASGAVIPFAILTPDRYLDHNRLRQLTALWRDLTPHVPELGTQSDLQAV